MESLEHTKPQVRAPLIPTVIESVRSVLDNLEGPTVTAACARDPIFGFSAEPPQNRFHRREASLVQDSTGSSQVPTSSSMLLPLQYAHRVQPHDPPGWYETRQGATEEGQ